jgi:hypothetical protein
VSTHPGMVIIYNAAGDVIAHRDWMVIYDEMKMPIGLVDFAAHEEAGLPMTDVFYFGTEIDGVEVASEAKGAKVWPEWIDRPFDFRVELEGPPGKKRIAALVNKKSGYRRERAVVEAEIERRFFEKRAEAHAEGRDPAPADLRDLVGGPNMPLRLDDEGRTLGRALAPTLPFI